MASECTEEVLEVVVTCRTPHQQCAGLLNLQGTTCSIMCMHALVFSHITGDNISWQERLDRFLTNLMSQCVYLFLCTAVLAVCSILRCKLRADVLQLLHCRVVKGRARQVVWAVKP